MLMKLTPWRGKTLTKYIKALIDLYGFNLSIISWWQKPVLFFISNYQNDYNKWSETVILITLNTYVSRKLFFTYFNWIYVFFSQLKASCNVYADVTSAQYVQGTESWSVVSLEKMHPIQAALVILVFEILTFRGPENKWNPKIMREFSYLS